MKNYLLFFFIFYMSLQAQSQTVSGIVHDDEGKPLPFANVLLLTSKDSTLIKGAASDESGAFQFENLNYGSYLLAATMVGYKMRYSPVLYLNDTSKEIKVPILNLSNDVKLLKEVTVETTRPFIQQELDRTVVNVANSIIASGSTALEVLEKAPGVIIDQQNDAISLRGKEGVIVQIDGKQTYLAMADVVALLRSTSSDNIDKIELITNPSAKYDAAGNAGIINIRMKKNNNIGTNGSLSLGVGSGRYERERGSIQVNHREKKFNVFGNYSANNGGNYWDFKMSRIQADGEQFNFIYQNSYLRFKQGGQNAKAGLDYFIGQNTIIGLVYTGFWDQKHEDGQADASFRRNELGNAYLQTSTHKTLSSVSSNQVANLNFQHTFKTNGGLLSADMDVGQFLSEYSNGLEITTLLSEVPSGLAGLFTQMPTTIDILTLKTDYSRTLPGNWKLETGFKRSSVRSDNNMTLSSGLLGEMKLDPEISNHFQYTEQVNALYSSLSGKLLEKTEMQLGLRAEHTHSIGHSLSMEQRVNLDYLNIFPSFFVSKSLSEKHRLTYSYSYRIDRPNYQNLNPSRGYVDAYLFRRGNPFLKPQFTHAMELKYGFENKIFASIGADFISDFVLSLIQVVDKETTEYTPFNIDNVQNYNLGISFPLTMAKGWTFQGNIMGIFSQMQFQFDGSTWYIQQLSGRLNGNNSILLGKGWVAELSGWVNTPAQYALLKAPWLGSLDAGIQKSLGLKWKVKLSGQDLLLTNRFIRSSSIPNLSQTFHITRDTRVVMLNATYTFGNKQLKGSRQRKLGSEEEMQRTN